MPSQNVLRNAFRLVLCAGIFFLVTSSVSIGAESARKIIVARDGSGDFTTIAAALASANGATRESPVDIIIKPGTYEETITTRHWINLIGEDRDTCVMTFHGGTEELHRKHVIWSTSNTTIKNLTLVGIQVKYCIHSDRSGPYVLNVENCVLRRLYPKEFPKIYTAAFGIGLWADQHIIMKDCLLEADLPVCFHNWYNQAAPCSMTLENCALKGKDVALEIILLGSKQHDFFVIHDSVIEGAKASIQYANVEDQPTRPWRGESELELIGSGNTLSDVTGTEMKDDSQNRLSGLERARQTEPNPLPQPGPVSTAE